MLVCTRCIYAWDYKGHAAYLTSCPRCHSHVRFKNRAEKILAFLETLHKSCETEITFAELIQRLDLDAQELQRLIKVFTNRGVCRMERKKVCYGDYYMFVKIVTVNRDKLGEVISKLRAQLDNT